MDAFTALRRGFRLVCFRMGLVWLLVAMSAPPLSAQEQVSSRVSHNAGAAVLDFQISPDGSRIAYRIFRAGSTNPYAANLFVIPATGGPAVQLNPSPPAGEGIHRYFFSPDSSQIFFTRTLVDATLDNTFQLFRVRADGSTAPVAIGDPISVGAQAVTGYDMPLQQNFILLPQAASASQELFVVSFSVLSLLAPERIQDGTSNTFFASESIGQIFQLFGDETVRRLNPDLVSGGMVYDFQITPDGARVIYRADQDVDGTIELFSIPSDGSDAGIRISGRMPAGGDVRSFQISANSQRVVYLADQTTSGVVELFSAPARGGVVTKLNGPLVLGGNVTQFQISPDGSRVLYIADQHLDGLFGLFSVPITGGSAPVRLDCDGPCGALSVKSFRIRSDSSEVFYVGEHFTNVQLLDLHLFRAPIGGGGRQRLSTPPVARANTSVLDVDATGTKIVYLSDAGNDGIFELTSLSLGAFGEPVTLSTPRNGPMVAGGNILDFKLSPDGGRIIYRADQMVDGFPELFVTGFSAGGAQRVNNSQLTATVPDWQLSPDGRIVYFRVDPANGTLLQLFAGHDVPQVNFSQSGYVVAEDGSIDTQLLLRREGIAIAPGSVRVELIGEPEGGTATGGASLGQAGVDFVDTAREINFGAGQVEGVINVPVKPDNIAEPAETFTMRLFDPFKVVIGALATARVTIKDNSSAPLLENTTRSIAENSPNGAQLLPPLPTSVSASTVTTYTILSGDVDNAFRIDGSDTLIVNNSAALDYESRRSFVLEVEVRIDGGSFDVATVQVNVLDVNEAPVFAAQVRSVSENSPVDTLVGLPLAASDPDGDPLTFSLVHDVFSITSGGQLKVKNSAVLDFETKTEHQFAVTVSDGKGLSRNATITVKVLDVDESLVGSLTVDALNPSAAVAGSSAFTLKVTGQNFTETSVVRWNGSTRRTKFSSRTTLYAAIPSTDIAAATTAKVDVLDTATGKSSNTLLFPVFLGKVGISEIEIEPAEGGQFSLPGKSTLFTLTWTHTSQPWRAMDEMDLRLEGDEQTALWVRYQQSEDQDGKDTSTLTLLNADGRPVGSGRFGESKVLENEMVSLDLYQSSFTGSGPTGRKVTVRFAVLFKEAAASEEPYNIELFGVDDLGDKQGPDLAGGWTIGGKRIYLPVLQR
jgi:Tol biopolymer transport system component